MNVQCPDHVGLYWPIYLLEVIHQYSTVRWSGRPFSWDSVWWCWTGTSSSCWPGCISGISPSCLHGDHGGHASEPVPKDGLVTSCWCRYVLILQKALKDRSASVLPTGSVQPMHRSYLTLETDLHQHAEDIPKGWEGDSVQVASPSGQPRTTVGVGRSSSRNFMQLRCYIRQTWLQLQKVDWDQAESKLIWACSSLRLVWHKLTLPGPLLGSLVPCGSRICSWCASFCKQDVMVYSRPVF